jgi:hypothetical protein
MNGIENKLELRTFMVIVGSQFIFYTLIKNATIKLARGNFNKNIRQLFGLAKKR